MNRYIFHSDPSHGWLEVNLQELKDLGIAAKISGYSYVKGDRVFLEEDSDLTKFMQAKGLHQLPDDTCFVHKDTTPIRTYRRYEGGL